VVSTSGASLGSGAASVGVPGFSSDALDEAALARQLGTPTGMLRALSVATPTPGNRCVSFGLALANCFNFLARMSPALSMATPHTHGKVE